MLPHDLEALLAKAAFIVTAVILLCLTKTNNVDVSNLDFSAQKNLTSFISW